LRGVGHLLSLLPPGDGFTDNLDVHHAA